MTDWRGQLRAADRARAGEMDEGDVRRMRAAVLRAAAANRDRLPSWSRPFVVTAAILVLACAGMLAALHAERNGLRPASLGANHESAAGGRTDELTGEPGRQQLQFSTPGGTRIIWVFDAGFEVKGTLP